jgi:hypothetical protein
MSNRTKDYGIVLRLPNIFEGNRKFYIFLVGGIHAPSTREAARLLNELWSDSFSGIVFEMDFMMEGTGRIIHVCK